MGNNKWMKDLSATTRAAFNLRNNSVRKPNDLKYNHISPTIIGNPDETEEERKDRKFKAQAEREMIGILAVVLFVLLYVVVQRWAELVKMNDERIRESSADLIKRYYLEQVKEKDPTEEEIIAWCAQRADEYIPKEFGGRAI